MVIEPPGPESPSWRRYLRFWRTDVAADVNEEIAFHIEGIVAQQVAAGVPEPEARRIANERFGNADEIAGRMRALATQRETSMRRSEVLSDLGRDLRFARRQLAKRPGFTVVAIVTLALGIGANTAIFSAVNSVLLHPLAVPAIGQLSFVHANLPKLPLLESSLDPTEVLAMAEHPGVFQSIGGFAGGYGGQVLATGGQARFFQTATTLGRPFDVFGLKPVVGRFYGPDESIPGRHRVVVLSYDVWQELGGQPSIVGSRLQFLSGSYEVVGVAPPNFRFPYAAELWTPYAIAPAAACGKGNRTPDGFPCRTYLGRLIMNTVGRVRPGTTAAAMDAYLDAVRATVHPTTPKYDYFYSTKSFVTETAGELRPALLALLGAGAVVLRNACANIASLQLVHGAARTREMAVRTALGAERATIVRQLLVENTVLSVCGGVAGLGVGVLILRLLALSGGAQMPELESVGLDGTVLGFTALATIASGLLFGLIPALRSSRVDLQSGLKEGRGQSLGARKNRLLNAGVMIQVALTLVLLLGSTLMVRTMARLLDQSPGFRAEGVATMRVSATGPRYSGRGALPAFYHALLDRVSHANGIVSAGLVSDLPFTGGTDNSPFTIDGVPADPKGPERHANLVAVGGDYFKAMGIPLLRGRAFNDGDTKDGAPVAIIDQTMARQFFGSIDPIGKRINQSGPMATIIGVVGIVSQIELGGAEKATAYYPMDQHDWYSSPYLVARSAFPLGTVTGLVRGATASIDPNLAVFAPRLLAEQVSASLAPRRLTMTVMSGLAVVSLLLAVCGLYGVISYVVSQRSTEFGIRLALGAQPSEVRRMVVGQGVGLAAGGIVIGVLGAAAGAKALGSLLYGVSAHDPASFVLAAVILAVVAVGASYLPARRATKVSPVEVLRRGE